MRDQIKAGYKQLDIGIIPEDWDEVLIGDIFEFKNGLNKAKEFFGYGTPIVNYMDVFKFSGLRLDNVQGKVHVSFREKQNFTTIYIVDTQKIAGRELPRGVSPLKKNL